MSNRKKPASDVFGEVEFIAAAENVCIEAQNELKRPRKSRARPRKRPRRK